MPVKTASGQEQTQAVVQVDLVGIPAGSITETLLAASVAGDGLVGGGGSALDVNVDDSSIEISTDTVQVKAAGIDETHLAASVAGNGLTGGAGTALAVQVDNSSIEIVADTLQLKDAGIAPAKLGSGFTAGTPVTNNSGLSADDTLDAYTPDDESGAYTGIDNAQGGTVYAQLADLNALRTAYENLRAHCEDLTAAFLHVVDLLEARNVIPS